MDLIDLMLINTLLTTEQIVGQQIVEDEDQIIPLWMFQQDNEQVNDELVDDPFSFDVYFQEFLQSQRNMIELQRSRIRHHLFLDRLFEHYIRFGRDPELPDVKIELKENKEKSIDPDRNTECPITYDTINTNDAYLKCGECKYNFTVDAIVKHLNSRDSKDCPMCRKKWTDYCTYINIDPEVERKKVAEKCRMIYDYAKSDLKNDKKQLKMGEYMGVNKTRNNKKWFYGK
jgi:hypothetical protein